MKKILLLLISLLISGCGTLLTRFAGDPVGAYPMQGIAVNARVIGGGINEFTHDPKIIEENSIPFLLVLLSFPCDLFIDVVLIPADLIAWPFGYKKENFDI
jgi:uncharacterized protein YceK